MIPLRSGYVPVSKDSRCSVCGGITWCARTSDGLVRMCRRPERAVGEVKGVLKRDANGAEYLLVFEQGQKQKEARLASAIQRQPALAASADLLHLAYTRALAILTLAAEHRANLLRRGLSEGEIDRRGYRTLPAGKRSEIAQAVIATCGNAAHGIPGIAVRNGSAFFAGAAGILVPVRNLEGRIVALKVRADCEGSGPRYSYISSKRHGGAGPGAPIHVPLWQGGASRCVRVTEGELKADVVTVLSAMLTISVPGVANWRPVFGPLEVLRPETVRIAFDADWQTNEHVSGAMFRLARALVARGYRVEIETWQ